jgi:hypothetical protein
VKIKNIKYCNTILSIVFYYLNIADMKTVGLIQQRIAYLEPLNKNKIEGML